MKKKNEIKITREEFIKAFMDVIANPFEGNNDIDAEDRGQMQFATMMVGMLLLKQVENKLFGEE